MQPGISNLEIKTDTKILLVLSAVNLVYALIGGAIMMALESPNEEISSHEIMYKITSFLSNHSTCVAHRELQELISQVKLAHDRGLLTSNGTSNIKQWNYINSVFFVLTATTTIVLHRLTIFDTPYLKEAMGYGNQTPTTRGGKSFIVLYVLLGIPLTGLLLTGCILKLKKLINSLQEKKIKLRGKCQTMVYCFNQYPRLETFPLFLLLHSVLFILLMLIPSILFCGLEGWAFADAMYYCSITFTTIGFGDYVVGTEYEGVSKVFYKIFVIIWIFAGMTWVGYVISITTEKYKELIEKRTAETQETDISHKPEVENHL